MRMMKKRSHVIDVTSRREFLARAGSGFGAVALAYLLAEERGFAAAPDGATGQAREPHHPPRARSVIWLFMEGGPSHLDLFDPKPTLETLAGQPLPPSFGRPITAMGTVGNTIMPSKRTWKRHGQSGLWVSDWYPEIARHVDEMAMFHSCWADGLNHVGSVCQMNTGSILAGRPSMGAWVTYGLGTANQNLPTFVILTDAGEVLGGPKNWSAGFLPASYQGTLLRKQGPPMFHLTPPDTIGDEQQRSKIDLLTALNRRFGADKVDDSELDARIESYELAYRMQAAAPEAVDLTKESPATRELYGMNDPATEKFGTNCLLARRMVERGVRFIELYSGSGSGWDAHENIEANHSKMCRQTDRPIAGLLTDLKAHGLLDTTLVVWGGEFGRTPFNEKGTGRDHNPWGFTMWMAGGGIKGGQTIGATDEIGMRVVDKPCHVHDVHATILHLLGLNHRRLTFEHNGRDERATINGGKVFTQAIA